jgi:Zn-dependent protease
MRAMGLPVIPFGWAKPVPFDPYNLKNPRRDSALISFAGPSANIIMAIVLSLVLRLLPAIPSLYIFLFPIILLNILLALFNLIPIHPLDGGKIFVGLLPEKDAHEADMFLRRYGMIILLFLIFPTIRGTSPLFLVLTPLLNFILGILLPGNPLF